MAATMPTDAALALRLPPASSPREWLFALTERMDDHALFVLDPDGRIRGWSASAERLTGYSPQEAVDRYVSVFYPAEELQSGAPGREVEDALAAPVQCEGWWTRKDGTRFWARRVLAPLPGPGADADAVGVVVSDLSAAREAQRRLQEREECCRSLFEHTPDTVYTLDVQGCVTGANPACEAATGFRLRELLGLRFEALVEPGHRERARAAAARCARGEPQTAELTVRRRDGLRLELDATLVPIFIGGQPAGSFVVGRDATRRRELERRHAAPGEAAGDVPGRALFGERVARAIRVSAREAGRMLAVLVVGLDLSAPADAALDPAVAERLLAEIGDRLERCLRPGDTVCRLDGTGFGVLLDGIRGADDAARVARRIEASLEAPVRVGRGLVAAGASVGYAVSAAGRGTPDELLRSAEGALDGARGPRRGSGGGGHGGGVDRPADGA
jgi:PAS domain S-box-containing protein